jgi:hypothetical protein
LFPIMLYCAGGFYMARALHDVSILEMALIGYQSEKLRIEGKIVELQAQLKGKKVPVAAAGKAKPRAKRVLSEAARSRIAAAQKKRWAEHRKHKAAAEKG